MPAVNRSLVATERLLEPPGWLGAGHLRVHHERTPARSVDPAGDGGQVGRRPDRDAGAAEAAADFRDIGRREGDVAERMAVRAEMVDLRAVGLVVIYHDEQAQAEADRRFELADPHQRAAVAK